MIFTRPRSVAEAIDQLGEEEAFALAGGVSLVLLMNAGFADPERLVLLDRVEGLGGVALDDDGTLDLGAMCTHTELAGHPLVRRHLGGATDAFGRIGNVRVRNAGTIGGNLAHADPAQDPPVVLTALGARVVVQGPTGTREIPAGALSDAPFSNVLDDDELITRVHVPALSAGSSSSYLKLLTRTDDDYATVSACARIERDGESVITAAFLALGAVGPTVVAADGAASLLVGHRADDDVLSEVAAAVREAVAPSSDPRGSADYKREMAGVMAVRAVHACTPAR